MIQRGKEKGHALAELLKQDLYLQKKHWHHILWDPVSKTMITNRVSLAETQLLKLAGEKARTATNERNLNKLLASIDS
jgi:DNA sulfur modification protein DndB